MVEWNDEGCEWMLQVRNVGNATGGLYLEKLGRNIEKQWNQGFIKMARTV
jgi:hypothetical protein